MSLAISAWLLAACAASGGASEAPSTGGGATLLPPSSGKPYASVSQEETEVTGVVELGVEHGCTVLRTDTALYQLTGSTDPRIQPGARLTIRGRARTDLATTCQQGIPFQVIEVRPAEPAAD